MPHLHEKIDFTIAAYVVNNDRVLLINHLALKKWLPLGGHIELDEDPDQALLREVKEESGLEIDVVGERPGIQSEGTKFLTRPRFVDIHDISPTHRHVGMIYFASAKTDKTTLAEKEHSDIKWFSRKDLNDQQYNLAPAVRFYAMHALDELKAQPSPKNG